MGPLGIALRLGGGSARAGFVFAGGLPAGATLTRASAAMRWTAAGVLESVAAGVARFDHVPASGAARGLLIEAAVTNLAATSLTTGATDWQAVGTVKTGGQADPLGGTAAARFAGDGTNNVHGMAGPYAAASAGTTYTLSQLVRPDSPGRRIQLVGRANSFDGASRANFSLTGAGSVTATEACTAAIEQLSGGWYRISWTATATTSVSDSRAALWLIAADSDPRNPTLVSDEIFTTIGAQFEAGTAASSLIATGAGSATRAADVLTLDWASRGVANGAMTVRYTFDDGSSQDVATVVAGGMATVPTNLARRWLARADRI